MHSGRKSSNKRMARSVRWHTLLSRFSLCIAMCLSTNALAKTDAVASAPINASATLSRELETVFANRFRLDSPLQHLTLLISRVDNEEPLIIVLPDGSKLNARMENPNVHWWRSPTQDIVTVYRPPLGPWQISAPPGTVTHFIGIPDMQLSVDSVPQPLYQNEQLKLTARVLIKQQPLLRTDILQHLRLQAEFVPLSATHTIDTAHNDTLTKPIAKERVNTGKPSELVGELRDDGQLLDAKAGDGIFTMQLPVIPAPGEYLLSIKSGEGINLPASSVPVTVRPMPLQVQFLQGITATQPHRLEVSSDAKRIVPGSLFMRVKETLPSDLSVDYQVKASAQENRVNVNIARRDFIGNYRLNTWIYAQQVNDRPLSILLPEQRFMQVTNQQQTQQLLEQREWQKQQQALKEQAKAEFAAQIQRDKDLAAQRLQWVLLGVLAVIVVLGGVIGLCMRFKRSQQRRQALQVLRHQQESNQKVGQRDLSSSRVNSPPK